MRRRSFFKFQPLLAILLIAVLIPSGPSVLAAQGPTMSALRQVGASEVKGVYVRVPQTSIAGQPLQVLIALHGMAGTGRDFGTSLASEADAHGWLLVAPSITYGDWTNPEQIAREEPALVAWLFDYVSHLSDRTGSPVLPRVLFFGHSRGAQLALRFTEIHPEVVAGVAAVSAGTYTLPVSTDARTGQALDYPFGIANLAQTDGGQPFDGVRFDSVPIWIGVGGADTIETDVPDAWDPYIGPDRLVRAENFTQAVQALGANASLTVFPNADHTLTDDMLASGCSALAQDLTADAQPSGSPT
jgi:pimeloyl-ACP methyl ester carboxylesterase